MIRTVWIFGFGCRRIFPKTKIIRKYCLFSDCPLVYWKLSLISFSRCCLQAISYFSICPIFLTDFLGHVHDQFSIFLFCLRIYWKSIINHFLSCWKTVFVRKAGSTLKILLLNWIFWFRNVLFSSANGRMLEWVHNLRKPVSSSPPNARSLGCARWQFLWYNFSQNCNALTSFESGGWTPSLGCLASCCSVSRSCSQGFRTRFTLTMPKTCFDWCLWKPSTFLCSGPS